MNTPEIKILDQGAVHITSDCYMVLGNEDVICFYFDVDRRAWVESSAYSGYDFETANPTVTLGSEDRMYTEIEFLSMPGWKYHSSSGGKCIGIALVREAAYLTKETK